MNKTPTTDHEKNLFIAEKLEPIPEDHITSGWWQVNELMGAQAHGFENFRSPQGLWRCGPDVHALSPADIHTDGNAMLALLEALSKRKMLWFLDNEGEALDG